MTGSDKTQSDTHPRNWFRTKCFTTCLRPRHRRCLPRLSLPIVLFVFVSRRSVTGFPNYILRCVPVLPSMSYYCCSAAMQTEAVIGSTIRLCVWVCPFIVLRQLFIVTDIYDFVCKSSSLRFYHVFAFLLWFGAMSNIWRWLIWLSRSFDSMLMSSVVSSGSKSLYKAFFISSFYFTSLNIQYFCFMPTTLIAFTRDVVIASLKQLVFPPLLIIFL